MAEGLTQEVASACGLTSAEAAARLLEEGPNELATDREHSLLATVLEVMREPMLLLLVAAGALYLVLGDLAEALTLLAAVFLVIGIEIVQERKTERALAALKGLTSPRALVLRDGARVRIAGRDVVRSDVVLLAEGDRVPADARLLESSSLEIDESLLTGESVPVRKLVSAAALERRPGGHDQPFVYSGTLVVRGHGTAEVIATGGHSEIGKIGKSLEALTPERTPLQREVTRIVRVLATAGLGLCVLLFVVYGLTRGNFLEGLLAGIALAMSLLPEEFPVVLTVFFALGAVRLSRRRVLTRRLPTLEMLGTATVLCADKTGTLTENRMRIARLDDGQDTYVVGDEDDLPEAVHEIVEFGVLSSRADPHDPMELAFHRLLVSALSQTEHVHRDWELVREYPLSPSLLSMSQVWRAPDGKQLVIAAKGAPEAIFDLCHLDSAELARLEARVHALAELGLRVLAVAHASFGDGSLPTEQHDFAFTFVGLVGLEDPLREGVAAAVHECHEAGIRVLMITGDYPETARSIAERAGLDTTSGLLLGQDIEAMDAATLRARLAEVSVIARARPEHKLSIVRALSDNGEVVAMTGDGVNDAPALKAAHIGIAMGGRGTDVAREASALVITDDDFDSIVAAVRLGRRIFDNLQKAMGYVLAFHVPVAGMSLLPVLFGWPLAMLPVHIVLLELVVDPVCSVAFEAEPEETGIMQRPPRKLGRKLFEPRVLWVSLLQGASALGASLAIYAWALAHESSAESARAVAFTTLFSSNLALIFVNRSWRESALVALGRKNVALWIVVAFTAGVLLCALTVHGVSRLFGFGPVGALTLLTAALAGPLALAWFELVKVLAPEWARREPKARARR